jgi:histidine kinase
LEREVRRMQRLVRDLEELSRVEARQFRLDRRATAIAELIGVVAERLRWQFEGKHVALRFDVPPDLPNVNVDANRLTQVLTNLLGNALLYTPENGIVTVRVRREQNELRVAIQDTGIGIAPEHVPHLFERFYRVDKSRSRAGGGSGIGLTIAQHLVKAHGGRIWVESAGLGHGSTFTFALPISETRFQ